MILLNRDLKKRKSIIKESVMSLLMPEDFIKNVEILNERPIIRTTRSSFGYSFEMQAWYRLEFFTDKMPDTLPKIDQFRVFFVN